MFTFDGFGQYEIPVVTLCYPNKKELGQLAHLIDFSPTFRFNGVSEITFKYPKYTYNKRVANLFDKILPRMLLLIEGFGYYMITNNPSETSDGIETYKEVSAVSYEFSLVNKKINVFSGTYKFYDLANPQDSLLGKIIEQLPNWKVGYVTADLLSKYRTFDVSDNTVYNFLMNDVEQSYECIFTFDTISQIINAYTIDDIVKHTDIFLDFDNVLKEMDVEIIDDEIVTALACFGSNNLSITTANPIGGTIIYNFDYFKSMMSDALQNAITLWENKIADRTDEYRETLVEYRVTIEELVKAQSNLNTLNAEFAAIEEVQSVQIQGGIDKSDPLTYQETLVKLSQKQSEIDSQQIIVDNLSSDKESVYIKLTEINDDLSIVNNFSDELYKELDYFIIENTYQDDTFTQTTEMTDYEVQDMSIALYEQSVALLSRLSAPQYNIKVESVNFLLLKQFIQYSKTFSLGYTMNLEVAPDQYIEVVALEVSYNYDDPENFSLIFANRYRLNDADWQYSDLYQSTTKSTSNVSFNGNGWNDWKGQQNDVLNFINNSLDLTKNELINNANNITMTINQTGLRGKRLVNGEYSGNQVWLTNNVLAFSDDGFQTVKTAIGNINVDGRNMYGLNAEVLIGKTIIGNELTIGNEDNTVTIDGDGINVLSNDGRTRISINTDEGIRISQRNPDTGNLIKDTFYSDLNGNLTLEGSINALSGSIGGFSITSNGITNGKEIQLYEDGSGVIGLMTFGNGKATFDGNIYADNLDNGGITDIKIQNSTISKDSLNNGVNSDIGKGVTALEDVTALRGDFELLSATVAKFDELYASKAYIDDLTVNDLQMVVNGREYSIDPSVIQYVSDIKTTTKTVLDASGEPIQIRVFNTSGSFITESAAYVLRAGN